MSNPAELHYSKDHEWIRIDGDTATIGITEYAQQSLGDIVFVELPRVGQKFAQFASIGVVESVKSVSDLFTPVSGEIIEINATLADDPALVNRAPFAEGWMFKIKLDGNGESEVSQLMDAASYETFIAKA